MFRKFFLFVVISLWGVVVLPVPNRADAATPLTLAVIQNLRNLVQLMPQNQPNRQARKSDAMSPGDGLSTGRSALADLRFNDGSLARIGEQAVFRFLPKTRNFKLTTGTVLLLIPPGRGQTRINTPNAAAAIRGSALFVRYDEKTETTLVGALTNSGIQVSNKDASQNQELQAGQVIIIVKDKFKGLYDFDLRTFYETGELVKGLDLTLKQGVPNSDPAIASVQAETAAAVAAQSPLTGQDIVKNPSLVNPTTTSSPNSPTNNIIRNNSPVGTLLDTGQIVSNTPAQSDNTDKKNPNPPQPPVVTPQPPVVTPQPPVVTPQPPVVTPQPPVVTPQPPVVTPQPPVVT
ncbi:MAG: FecR family protein, partial [Scytonema hyalinum WJT4-NPBG1]|nr:FecR family protein [Scytonema hyalinum WJT4-NPBG1]